MFSLDLIFLHLFRSSPNWALEVCRSDPLVLLYKCSLFLRFSFFFSALCCSFFFLLFLCWICRVVVYIELEPSRLEFPRLNQLLYTQDVIYQICFAFLSTNDIVDKIRLSMCLDWVFCPIRVFCVLLVGPMGIVQVPQNSVKDKFLGKFGSRNTIHTFKNYFATIFSVISFQF